MKSEAQVSHLDLSDLIAIAGQADRSHPHLAHCELCREIAALIERVLEMGIPAEGSTSPDHRCIKELEISKLVEETTETRSALELLQHAVGCVRCGRRLKELAFVFSPYEDATVADRVNQLESSTPEWQRATVKKLTGSGRFILGKPMLGKSLPGNWRIWTAVAAGAVIAITTSLSWNSLEELWVERLLAKAYTEGRPFEYRLPGSGYATVTRQMGSSSLVNIPLKKADGDLADLPKSDQKARWLQGRADLLRGDTDSAILELRNLDLPGEESSLDLAIALALRGDPNKRTEDWGEALEFVSRYLVAHPTSPEGLYNKALILERLRHVDEAIAAWDRYLEVDATGPWAAEATQHKADLQTVKTTWQQRHDRLAPTNTFQPSLDSENYLGRIQLGKIRSLPREDQLTVGDLLFQQHQDDFLRDLFKRQTSATDIAFDHLHKAFDAVDQESYKAAIGELREAETQFAAGGNLAGKFRAGLERTYALQRSLQSDECVTLAEQLHEEIPRTYPWMQIQADLQFASCAELGGRTADALSHLQEAQELAEKHSYLGTGLRASGIFVESMTRLGDRSLAWTQGVRDMETYWKHSSDQTREYQILINQVRASEKMGWVHTQAILESAACREVGRIRLPLYELTCRIELAAAARRIKDEQLASLQMTEAGKLVASMQEEVNSQGSPAQTALIRYASALLDGGDTRGAATLLDRVASAANSKSFATRLLYFTTVGRRYLADHQADKAEVVLDQAKQLVMNHLDGLKKDVDKGETAEAAALYRLGLEAHIPSTGGGEFRPEDLEAWESFRASVRDPGGSPKPVSLLKPRLTEETVLILVRLSHGIVAFTVDDRGIASHWTPLDMDELDKSIRHMTELCADPQSSRSDIEREGRRLYRWLIAPVANHLKGRNLIAIEPDESLAAVPFRALVTDSGDYWGKQAVLEEIDSVSDYLKRRSQPQPQPGAQTLLVSSPNIKGKLEKLYPPLDFAKDPISASDGRAIVRLAGPQATLENIDKKRSEANVFQFFGHATSTAEASALLIAAENGDAEFLLNANRLRGQDWSQTRLVVLSACSTAAGETFGPANRDGLVRGFLGAGAARVIASQWDVNAVATAQLFQRFYDQMAKSGDTARALQAAEIEVARDYNHPYYWAAFNLYGTH